MNGVDRVKAICKERKIPLSKLERDLGYGNGYIGQLRKGVFPSDRLMEIAEYLQLSPDYILSGENKSAPVAPKYDESEKMLIDLFRKIPADRQELVLQMIKAALGISE